MRLTATQLQVIRQAGREIFGSDARVRVFGSRLDDSGRGGDIDILVESDEIIDDKLMKSLTLVARLQLRLGDQPIDVLVVDPETPLNPVHRHAMQTGVTL